VRVRSARAAEHVNLVGLSTFGATCEPPVPLSAIRLRPYSAALFRTSNNVQRSLHTITMPQAVAFVGGASLRPYAARACPSLVNHQGSLRPVIPASAAPARPRLVRAPHCCVPNAAMETPQEPARSKSAKLPSPGVRKFSVLGVLFLLCAYAWSILLIVPMIVAHPFVLALDRHRRRFHDFVSLTWMKLSMATTLFVPQVVNRANLPSPGSPCVYVANHTSYLDIFASAFLGRNIKFVSKTEIFRLPVIGWAMNMRGHIGVNRMNRVGQAEAYRKMVSSLRDGVSLVVYPEGTRSETGKMRKFQAGAFRAAKAAGVPVVPVTITGTREVMPSRAFVPLSLPKEPIRLTVHPAINPEANTVEELRDQSFAAIDSSLDPSLRSSPVST
jgi:1-acyl-sn-glycerol-3-phosphate acyltransferase